MKELPVRKGIRLKGYNYSSSGYYFVTVCVKDKHEMLGKVVVGDAVHSVTPHTKLSEYGLVVKRILEMGGDARIQLDRYIVMPNHIHMILIVSHDEKRDVRMASPTREKRDAVDSVPYTKSLVSTFVRSFKTMTTKQIGFSLWQRSFHDRIIRNEDEYQRIWQYIDENPLHWAEDDYFV
ncbi:MAG: hypothetical protein FWE06_04340 [Oscillospiraceae bacterium]|nr:hypothetical protein [Oscillospiraceae bacterium]